MRYYLFKIGEILINALPLEAAYDLASGIADIKYFFSVKDKLILVKNLQMSLGITKTEAKRYARLIFRNFCKYLVDFFRQDRIDQAYINNFIKIKGREYVDEAFRQGKGVIALSAHIGNWELGAVVFSLLGYPLNVIALSHKDERINNFFNRKRLSKGVKVIQLGGSVKKCFRALDRNEAVAVLADRDFSNSNFMAEFFGKETSVPKGVGILKLKKGSVIVPTFMIRQPDDTYVFTFEKPIEYNAAGNEEEVIKGIVQESLKIIERYAQEYPDQWFMFARLWPEAKQ